MNPETNILPVSILSRHLQKNLALLQSRQIEENTDAYLKTLVPSLLVLAFMGGVLAGNGPVRSALSYQLALRAVNKLTMSEQESV